MTLLVARPRGQSAATVFSEPASDAAASATVDAPAGLRRVRHLAPAPGVLDALLSPGTAPRPEVVLNLFPDVRLRLARERLEFDRRGHVSWVGHVDGDAQSTVSLTWDGVVLSGSVVSGGAAYDLTTANGAVLVADRDVTIVPRELPALVPSGTAAAPEARADLSAPATTAAVDVLVLYTPAASAGAGGDAQMQSQLANAVAVTNTAFQRSGVDALITAVAVQPLAYTEGASLSADLSAISGGGAMSATIEAARSAVGADLVALVTGRASTAGGCGIAWLGPSAGAAYSATEQACLYAGQWSFSHELGHNFGADHAPGDSTPIGVAYAHGYRDGGSIRTLMAYAVAGSPPRLLNYSSATVLEPAGTGIATGNSLQDNARRLSETASTVAAYKTPPGGNPPAVPGTATNLMAAVYGTTVTLSWTPPAGGASSYDLEVGSAPGAGNLGHFTLASSPSAFTGVPVGSYHVRLRSVGPGGSSAPTADVPITVGPAPCVPPGALSLAGTVTGGVATLTWTMPSGSGPFAYYLGVGSQPGSYDIGIFPMGAARSYVVAPPRRTYYVKAAATNACGMGPITADLTVVVP